MHADVHKHSDLSSNKVIAVSYREAYGDYLNMSYFYSACSSLVPETDWMIHFVGVHVVATKKFWPPQ